MTHRLVGEPDALLAVGIATTTICLVLLLLVRVFGTRSLTTTSTIDIACMAALGAVVGRTILLTEPTLATGVVALMLLFLLQRGLAAFGRRPRWRGTLSNRPVVLIVGGVIDEAAVRANGLSSDELRQRLRVAGVARRSQVSLAVLEPTGAISVLCDTEPEEWLTDDLPCLREPRGLRKES